jgi:hypothetical protein
MDKRNTDEDQIIGNERSVNIAGDAGWKDQ